MISSPTRPRAGALLGLAVLGLAALTLYANRERGAAIAVDGSVEARMAAMERQQREILGLLHAQREQGNAGSRNVTADAGPERLPSPEERQRRSAAEFQQFAVAHAQQPIDSSWAPGAERQLATAAATEGFAEGGLNPDDLSVECRSRSCRVVARFARSGDALDWSSLFITQSAPTLAQARESIVMQPDGSYELRILGIRR